jgi:uncharacterized protein YecE (DUF72 family)
MMRAWIGTSGWNYKHWRNLIYPEKLAQKKWLEFIARDFDTVELNTSFYRIPQASSVQAWQESAPPSFRFAVKLWRGITHYRKLVNSGEFLQKFFDVVNSFDASRRAPVLIQLPPSQGKAVEKLDSFLHEFKRIAGARWAVAVEFRHPSWLDPEVYRILDRYQAALCLHDMEGKAATDEPNDSPLIYIRRHGSSEARYEGSYSPEHIERDANHIRSWLREGKAVYVYYNNDIGGHAFWNARDLKGLLSG